MFQRKADLAARGLRPTLVRSDLTSVGLNARIEGAVGRRWLAGALARGLGWVGAAIIGATASLPADGANLRLWAINAYVARIPNGSVFNCSNCHAAAINGFGNAFLLNGRVWNAALASADSDNDGATNGAELQDPNGLWQQGQPNPGTPALVTNPGDPNSRPTPTPTPSPTPTTTPTPTPTPTPIPTPPGVRLTSNDIDENWSPRDPSTTGGRVLWFDGDGDVWFFDGATATLVQALDPDDPSLDDVADFVFGVADGAAAGQVVAAWRRGTDFAWVWSGQGQAPRLVSAVNPIDVNAPLNPENLGAGGGGMFLILQAFFGGDAVKHVFRIDLGTGQATNLSGSDPVPGVADVVAGGARAAWIYKGDRYDTAADDGQAPTLRFYDGAKVAVVDAGDLRNVSLSQGRLVFDKVLGYWVAVGNLASETFFALAADRSPGGAVYAAPTTGLYKSTDGGLTWSLLTGLVSDRRVRGLAVDGARVLAASHDRFGGPPSQILLSTNAGASWAEVVPDGGELGETNKALAIDPATPTTLYAGNFELPSMATGDSFLIKSTDGGLTWGHVPDFPGGELRAYALLVDSSGVLYAGGTGTPNLVKSSDGGSTWIDVALPSPNFIYSLALDPNGTLMAGTLDNGAYRSTDGGLTWTQINAGLRGSRVSALALDPEQAGSFHAATDLGFYLTGNSGDLWQERSEGLTEPFLYALTLTSDKHLIAGSAAGLFRMDAPMPIGVGHVFLYDAAAAPSPVRLSPDVPLTESHSFPLIHGRHVAWVHRVSGANEKRYLALNGGLRLSDVDHELGSQEPLFQLHRSQWLWIDGAGALRYDDGRTPTLDGRAPAVRLAESGVFNRPWLADGHVAMLGPGDDGGSDTEVYLLTATPPADAEAPPPPIVVLARARGDGTIDVEWDRVLDVDTYNLYRAEQAGLTKENYQSLPGGARVTGLTDNRFVASGLKTNETYYFVVTSVEGATEGPISREARARPAWAPSGNLASIAFYAVAADAGDADVAYAAGGESIYKTTDGGTSWMDLLGPESGRDVRALAVDGARVLAATRDGDILRSTDGGATWTVTADGDDIGELNKSLTVDPTAGAIAYAGDFSLAAKTAQDSYLIKTTDGGSTWAHLPDIPGGELRAYALAVTGSGRLYAGGTGTPNAAVSTDGGLTWTAIGLESPNYVYSLAIDPAAPLGLFAGTRDNGVYRTSDGGMTWAQKSQGLPSSFAYAVNALVVSRLDASTLFAGTFEGFHVTSDAAETWTGWDTGLPTAGSRAIYDLALLADHRLLAATAEGLFILDLSPAGATPTPTPTPTATATPTPTAPPNAARRWSLY